MSKQTQKRARAARAKRRARAWFITLGAVITAVMLLCGMSLGWFTSEDKLNIPAAPTDDSGILRVYLKSLGSKQALGLTLDGVYSVDGDAGFRFTRGSAVNVAEHNGALYLSCGGLTIDMGEAFTLKRHMSEDGIETNGLYIHESEKDTLYAGDLHLSIDAGGIRSILSIQIEDYLYGVVAYEMSDSFPLEALKAQAVAARTYAIRAKKYAGSKDHDVNDTTADQVYKGFDPRYVNVIKAVDDTRGVTGLYKGDYAGCYYTASNGGQVASTYQIWGRNGDYDYIQMKDDPYDLENELSVVKRAYVSAIPDKNSELYGIFISSITETLSQMGYSDDVEDIVIERIRSITPVNPDIEGSKMYSAMDFALSVSGRKWVDVPEATSGEATVSEPRPWDSMPAQLMLSELKPIEQDIVVQIPTYQKLEGMYSLNISSGNIETYTAEPLMSSGGEALGFNICARRFGHGVGMSQRGAQVMAQNHNMNYDDILKFYYPGMELKVFEWNTAPLKRIGELPKSLGYARSKPTPKPTQQPLPALKGNEYYARVTLATASSSLNVRQQPNTDSRILGTLDHANRVIVIAEAPDGWLQIKTVEIEGYVKGDYLTKEAP